MDTLGERAGSHLNFLFLFFFFLFFSLLFLIIIFILWLFTRFGFSFSSSKSFLLLGVEAVSNDVDSTVDNNDK